MFIFDLPYILAHPLLKRIVVHCAELEEEASGLPEGSTERKEIASRISELEEYKLPKPDARDLEQSRPIVDKYGRVVGERHSLRRRFREKSRGRPAEYRLQVRAALEEKLANPDLKWRDILQQFKSPRYAYHFKKVEDLQRAVRRLKALLRREGIPLPHPSEYRSVEENLRSFI